MTIRARGANAILAFAFGSTYDTPPDADHYFQVPFVSSALGADRPLQEDDLLGQGREQQDPDDDVVTASGDIVVPVDVRNFGLWLKALFGAPTTANQDAASGSWLFSDQPAADSTITVNGTVFTFKESGAAGPQSNIGADVEETIDNLVTVLNGSVVSGVALATYSKVDTDTLKATLDATGLAGNGYTLAAGVGSNATPSGATASGGTVKHTFLSGSLSLPAFFTEVQLADIDSYRMIRQIRAGSVKIALTRKGKLNATVSCIAKGENDPVDESSAGTLTSMLTTRFSQGFGSVTRNGVQMGSVVSAEADFDNSLDTVEVIRSDGEIEDADAAESKGSGQIVVRLTDENKDIPVGATNPCVITAGWAVPGSNFKLTFTYPRAFLPKVKDSITGPAGIQKTYSFQTSKDPILGHSVKVELVNDVANYNNP